MNNFDDMDLGVQLNIHILAIAQAETCVEVITILVIDREFQFYSSCTSLLDFYHYFEKLYNI